MIQDEILEMVTPPPTKVFCTNWVGVGAVLIFNWQKTFKEANSMFAGSNNLAIINLRNFMQKCLQRYI